MKHLVLNYGMEICELIEPAQEMVGHDYVESSDGE